MICVPSKWSFERSCCKSEVVKSCSSCGFGRDDAGFERDLFPLLEVVVLSMALLLLLLLIFALVVIVVNVVVLLFVVVNGLFG